jgi:GTPase SAR1 family protein
MNGMDVSWVLPARQEAYKRREEIQAGWAAIQTWVKGQKKTIVMTGGAGVGKSVLLDHLSGDAYKQGYKPPTTSQTVESKKAPANRQRIFISALPGQDSPRRFEGIQALFRGKTGVDGVIHVVGNGFTTIRNQSGRESLVRDKGLTTLHAFRQFQRAEDLRDLSDISVALRDSINKHRKPAWMIVAVNKMDLFYDDGEISEAARYYSPEGSSEFSERIETLRRQVGTDNFRWTALPVCGWLEDFTWNGETQTSILKPNQRDHFLSVFMEQLDIPMKFETAL